MTGMSIWIPEYLLPQYHINDLQGIWGNNRVINKLSFFIVFPPNKLSIKNILSFVKNETIEDFKTDKVLLLEYGNDSLFGRVAKKVKARL